jgi:hypothetical protein
MMPKKYGIFGERNMEDRGLHEAMGQNGTEQKNRIAALPVCYPALLPV